MYLLHVVQTTIIRKKAVLPVQLLELSLSALHLSKLFNVTHAMLRRLTSWRCIIIIINDFVDI